MRVYICLYAAAAAYRLIYYFRSKSSGSLFETLETAPFYRSKLSSNFSKPVMIIYSIPEACFNKVLE